jgi:hypothetical protein
MKTLFALASCSALVFVSGCATGPASIAADLLTKEKNELLGKLDKSLPEADKLIDQIKTKLPDLSGDSKASLEKILTKLQDLR